MISNKIKILSVCAALALPMAAQTADTLSISAFEYKQRVLEYSRQVKQSEQDRLAMVEAVKHAKTAFLPGLDANGSYNYRLTDYNIDFGGSAIGMEPESYSVGATLAQPIYMGGQIRNTYKATKVQAQIAEQAVALTVDNIVQAAEQSYWNASAMKEMYETMCQYVDIIQNLERVLTDRFEAGQISKTDLISVQARLKEAESQRINTYKSYQLALQNLNVLMGEEPLNPVHVQDDITTYLTIPIEVEAAQALKNRPDYSIAQLNVDYQRYQVKLAKAKYNPSFSIGLQGTWGTSMLNFDGTTLFNATAFASIKIPLFHWGARHKAANTQKALLRSKEFAQQAAEDKVKQEVAAAWTNVVQNTKQLKVVEENCHLAEENLDLNTFSYNEGKLPIVNVLNAQLTWIQSYSNLIQTWFQHKSSLSAYNKAVGSVRENTSSK